jgi:pimeloyl-ACP methyl ester carboxylesterase
MHPHRISIRLLGGALIAALVIGFAACGDSRTGLEPSDVTNGSQVQSSEIEQARANLVPIPECPVGTVGATGTIPGSGALYLFCVPPTWNGSLVVYAHGYVSPQDPLAIRDDVIGGLKVSEIVTSPPLNFAFAATSYRNNGLIVVEGARDLARLIPLFRELVGPVPGITLAVGASEGAAIATLATERHSELFDGTLAACGPLGDFQGQLDYLQDFRVLFDYFFPGVIPPSPVDVPAAVEAAFGTGSNPGPLRAAILASLAADPLSTQALLATAGINLPPDPTLIGGTVLGLLSYNVLGFNDAVGQLGGSPYDNTATVYPPPVINATVPRFTADQPALSHVKAKYETRGRLKGPLVTIHNLFDPIVPYDQGAKYAAKVSLAGRSAFLTQIPGSALTSPYGHCMFTLDEVVGAFGLLIGQVTGVQLAQN